MSQPTDSVPEFTADTGHDPSGGAAAESADAPVEKRRPPSALMYLVGALTGIGALITVLVAPIDHNLFVHDDISVPSLSDDSSAEAPAVDSDSEESDYIIPDEFIALDQWAEYDGAAPDAESVTVGEKAFSIDSYEGYDGDITKWADTFVEFLNASEEFYVLVTAKGRVQESGGDTSPWDESQFAALVGPGRSAFTKESLDILCDPCQGELSVEFAIVGLRWYAVESDELRSDYADGKDPGLTEVKVEAIDEYSYSDITGLGSVTIIETLVEIYQPSDLAFSMSLRLIFRDKQGELIGSGIRIHIVGNPLPPGTSMRTIRINEQRIPEGADLSNTEFQVVRIRVL